jgi:hypothetical protein
MGDGNMSDQHEARLNGRNLVEFTCGHCSSSGYNPSTRLERVSTPENTQRMQAHANKVECVIAGHEAMLGKIREQAKRDKRDATPFIKALHDKTNGVLQEMEKAAPKDESYLVVTECPWCKTRMDTRVRAYDPGIEQDPAVIAAALKD